jgi:hypothetical protein
MPVRLARPIAAAVLLFAMWALDSVRGGRHTARSGAEAVGPVRILEFYASAGAIVPGEKAMLCYGVENAKSVRISPVLSGVYPSPNRCLEIAPRHTTHYTILAEGYDGAVDARSLTLPVQTAPYSASPALNAAVLVL